MKIQINQTYNNTNFTKFEIKDRESIEDLEETEATKKSTIETACLNLIRNNIQNNNMNITIIMEKPTIPKEYLFDKILIDSFKRCNRLMELEKANLILSIDSIVLYNPSIDKYISIDPEDYKLNSIPTFSQEEKNILNKFYGDEKEEKEKIEEFKFNNGNGFVEILDAPKNRHLLIGFSGILIFCYLIFTVCLKEKKVVDVTPPVFFNKQKKKKN